MELLTVYRVAPLFGVGYWRMKRMAESKGALVVENGKFYVQISKMKQVRKDLFVKATKITDKQFEVLAYIYEFMQHGRAPSLDEMAKHFGITKRGAVKHLMALEAKGAIKRGLGYYSIEIMDDVKNILDLIKQGVKVD